MEIKYLPENTNPQNSDWLLIENQTAAQKLSIENLLALVVTPTDLQISDVEGLQTALNNKADDLDISALSSDIATKANQTEINNLITTVSQKIDQSLTEITTISSNDYLILEKASDGSNKKAKVSAINSGSSGIITSSTVPNSPTSGLIWNEIDSTGNLIESWTWLNSQWVSFLKITDLTIPINTIIGTLQYVFPIENDYNIFFRAWSAFWQSSTSTDSNNYYQVQLRIYNGAIEIINNPLSPSPISFNNNPPNTPILAKVNLDKKYTTANMFRRILVRIGNPGSTVLLGVKIKYQLIRK